MKLSVSLPQEDVEFIDYYVTMHDLESRSAVFQAAIRALRNFDLEDQYAQAFSEEERYEDPAILEKWHQMAEAARARREATKEALKNASW